MVVVGCADRPWRCVGGGGLVMVVVGVLLLPLMVRVLGMCGASHMTDRSIPNITLQVHHHKITEKPSQAKVAYPSLSKSPSPSVSGLLKSSP